MDDHGQVMGPRSSCLHHNLVIANVWASQFTAGSPKSASFTGLAPSLESTRQVHHTYSCHRFPVGSAQVHGNEVYTAYGLLLNGGHQHAVHPALKNPTLSPRVLCKAAILGCNMSFAAGKTTNFLPEMYRFPTNKGGQGVDIWGERSLGVFLG